MPRRISEATPVRMAATMMNTPAATLKIRMVLMESGCSTSTGFSAKPMARYMPSSACSKPNTLPYTNPNSTENTLHLVRMSPISICIFLYMMKKPISPSRMPWPTSPNITPNRMA